MVVGGARSWAAHVRSWCVPAASVSHCVPLHTREPCLHHAWRDDFKLKSTSCYHNRTLPHTTLAQLNEPTGNGHCFT